MKEIKFYLILLALALGYIWSSSTTAKAANEYLNDYPTHCSRGSIEPYVDYSLSNSESGSYYTTNDSLNTFIYPQGERDEYRVGLRLRWELGSTCNDTFKRTMKDNMKLKQELELLKLCGRYKNLELGPEFATVREKCKDIQPKPSDIDINTPLDNSE
jgi:hypothetical protein|tara:strand:+ start:696 stop:1169 length:474 start_codon:yes stop_codon:yes gene_type:complete